LGKGLTKEGDKGIMGKEASGKRGLREKGID
jgi:hypothetical protein